MMMVYSNRFCKGVKIAYQYVECYDKSMNKAPSKSLSSQDKATLDVAVKKIVKRYHKTLIKLADT